MKLKIVESEDYVLLAHRHRRSLSIEKLRSGSIEFLHMKSRAMGGVLFATLWRFDYAHFGRDLYIADGKDLRDCGIGQAKVTDSDTRWLYILVRQAKRML